MVLGSGLILLSALTIVASAPANFARAYWLDTAQHPTALCLDGTPGLYYLRKATVASNASKWVFHIQGGGWCYTLEDCYKRSKTRLGSSLPKFNNNATSDLGNIEGCNNNRWCGALMVNDVEMNPLAYDWNAVLLMYCDGASWIGDSTPVKYKNVTLHFRGLATLKAILADLITQHGLGSATQVLFGGDSAGGLATYYHADRVAHIIRRANLQANMPPTTFTAMPDSGFWPDDVSQTFSAGFRNMFAMQNGSEVSTTPPLSLCAEREEGNETKCIFPENFASDITTQMLPLQSLYDPVQKGQDPQSHGTWLLQNLRRSVLVNPKNGAWLHSCERHCGSELLSIDGDQYPRAVSKLISGEKHEWFQNKSYPCESCCNDAV